MTQIIAIIVLLSGLFLATLPGRPARQEIDRRGR